MRYMRDRCGNLLMDRGLGFTSLGRPFDVTDAWFVRSQIGYPESYFYGGFSDTTKTGCRGTDGKLTCVTTCASDELQQACCDRVMGKGKATAEAYPTDPNASCNSYKTSQGDSPGTINQRATVNYARTPARSVPRRPLTEFVGGLGMRTPWDR